MSGQHAWEAVSGQHACDIRLYSSPGGHCTNDMLIPVVTNASRAHRNMYRPLIATLVDRTKTSAPLQLLQNRHAFLRSTLTTPQRYTATSCVVPGLRRRKKGHLLRSLQNVDPHPTPRHKPGHNAKPPGAQHRQRRPHTDTQTQHTHGHGKHHRSTNAVCVRDFLPLRSPNIPNHTRNAADISPTYCNYCF